MHTTELLNKVTEGNEILRFTTAGSVDDGKITLIGRLLYDSKSVFEDQLQSVKMAGNKRGHQGIDLALLTDGLREERDQGITIDVAYRYFSTSERKFIIADTPGHIQYTRNMVTGASNADAALVLVDIRKGVVEQTVRHLYLARLLGIEHVIICINKMDLVEYSMEAYESVKGEIERVSGLVAGCQLHYVPLSALKGDNVVEASVNMPWYTGMPLLGTLEAIDIQKKSYRAPARFPVQMVIRPGGELHDYRGFAGQVASGSFKEGEVVVVLPSGLQSRIRSIDSFDGNLVEASESMSVVMTLEDDIDVSRGDMIVKSNSLPSIGSKIEAEICWLHDKPFRPGAKYFLRSSVRECRAILKDITWFFDLHSLKKEAVQKPLEMNDIARVEILTGDHMVFDPYLENKRTGSFILIDELTKNTVAAGMVIEIN